MLGLAGVNVDELAGGDFRSLAARSPAEAMAVIRPALNRQRLTGTYQCTRRGMLKLYGFDVDSGDPREIEALNAAIAHAYSDMFAWYRAAMDKAHFSEVIRPVHPEYFTAQQSPETAARESAFVNTIMRIDSLLALWPRKCPRRDALANILGVEPVDAKSWREFIHAILDLAAENGTTGIKQAQAYDRRLTFVAREDSEVAFSADMTPEQVRVWQDWAAHVCFEYADDRGWPHQVHVGTHNLPHSSPLPLGDVAARYGRMKTRANPLLAVPERSRVAG